MPLKTTQLQQDTHIKFNCGQLHVYFHFYFAWFEIYKQVGSTPFYFCSEGKETH